MVAMHRTGVSSVADKLSKGLFPHVYSSRRVDFPFVDRRSFALPPVHA
jgi:hypothetical protein